MPPVLDQWLDQKRQAALTAFQTKGFPTTNDEAWRFTNISPIANTSFSPTPKEIAVDATQLQPLLFPGLDRFQIVFINGHWSEKLSHIPSIAGVSIQSLAHILKNDSRSLETYLGKSIAISENAFELLNTYSFEDGLFLSIAKGIRVEMPIHLVYFSTSSETPTASHPRNLIVTGQDSQVAVIETTMSLANQPYWTNMVTEIFLGENSRLDHYKIQQESLLAYHTSSLQVRQARSSNFQSHAILLGGAIVRNNINIALAEEGSECSLHGLYLTTGSQLTDSHTFIDHIKPHCTSRELYKGILDEKSRGVFDGQIIVRENAQKSDAVQTNRNLLLSDAALVNTKPELKIFNNDVKCKHGATVGQLNNESLFYLRSRGIPLAEARKLLIFAFASEMIELVDIPALRQGLETLLFAKFQHP